MKIVIDARMLFWTGIGRYTKALLDELQEIDRENDYVVLVRQADWQRWEPRAENFRRIESNIDPYSLEEQWQLPLQLKALAPDLVHFTAPNTPLFYGGRRVVTVHDLTLLDYNTSRGHGLVKALRGLKQLPFRLVVAHDMRADRLITVTRYVAGQLEKRFRARAEKITTTLLAADANLAEPESVARFGELGRYIFYVGNMYPYKNLRSTIAALAQLGPEHADVQLVAAGKRDEFTDDLEREARRLGVADRVKFVGYVSDGEMVALYRGAAVYVNPSLSEGFGLQGLEAMAQGTPLVAARASCLPEVYGEAAEYFEAKDAADQAKVLAKVLDDEGVAARLRAAGAERLKQFSWEKMARGTLAAYKAALEK